MRRVIIESPYRTDPNGVYLQRCIRDCLDRGEAPFASHRMYTSALDDRSVKERQLGINAGFAWHHVAEYVVVYEDLGVSGGMLDGIGYAESIGLKVVRRRLW